MKHGLLLLSSITVATLMTACTGQIPSMDTNAETDTTKREKECIAIDKKLIKVDKFTANVEDYSAFDLEELAIAVPSPEISDSNNKKRMLRDASEKRTKLLEEHKKLGCEDFKKQ